MAPPIASHPRFRLGRALMGGSGGGPEEAVDVFCALLEEAVERRAREASSEARKGPGGELAGPATSEDEGPLDGALAEYEYGNALFRAAVRREEDGSDVEVDSKPAAAAEPGGKRAAAGDGTAEGPASKRARTAGKSPTSDDDEDLTLGLRAMESSLCPVMEYYHGSAGDEGSSGEEGDLRGWARDQIARAMTSVGDVHSHEGRHGEAVDWYCRARPYAESSWEARKGKLGGGSLTVEDLRAQRRLVELDAEICEAMLSCPSGEDIAVFDDDDDDDEEGDDADGQTTSAPTRRLVCRAGDRLDFAAGHYDSARTGMEELIARYGRMKGVGAASAVEGLDDEGKDIGYAVMLVVGAGNRLEEERSA